MTAPLIRLYSQRRVPTTQAQRKTNPISYLVCDYDPQTRFITIVQCVPTDIAGELETKFNWPWDWEPWEKPDFSAGGLGDNLDPMYERADGDTLPSPGYGPVPGFQELGWAFADREFGLSAERGDTALPEADRQLLMDVYAAVTASESPALAAALDLLRALPA